MVMREFDYGNFLRIGVVAEGVKEMVAIFSIGPCSTDDPELGQGQRIVCNGTFTQPTKVS
jgi:hypothetical protein